MCICCLLGIKCAAAAMHAIGCATNPEWLCQLWLLHAGPRTCSLRVVCEVSSDGKTVSQVPQLPLQSYSGSWTGTMVKGHHSNSVAADAADARVPGCLVARLKHGWRVAGGILQGRPCLPYKKTDSSSIRMAITLASFSSIP